MTYRERRERKAERLRGWADKRDEKASAARGTADRIAGMIPPGQPILIGHHSESRHRRDLDRIDRGMRQSIEHADKAGEMRSRAANIETAAEVAIYSDDPDARERLAEKIGVLEAKRGRIKAYNATCRKGAPDTSLLAPAERGELAGCIAAWGDLQCEGGRFPGYVLTNLGGNINRLKKRLAAMPAKGAA